MSRDYKPRNRDKKNGLGRQKFGAQQPKIALWKWMLIVAIIITFAVFLFYLKTSATRQLNLQQSPQTTEKKSGSENKVSVDQEKKLEVKVEPKGPQFDFYMVFALVTFGVVLVGSFVFVTIKGYNAPLPPKN